MGPCLSGCTQGQLKFLQWNPPALRHQLLETVGNVLDRGVTALGHQRHPLGLQRRMEGMGRLQGKCTPTIRQGSPRHSQFMVHPGPGIPGGFCRVAEPHAVQAGGQVAVIETASKRRGGNPKEHNKCPESYWFHDFIL